MGKVIGSVTLSRSLEEVAGGRYVIVVPESGDAIRHGAAPTGEPVVVYDELSPGSGTRVAFSEGREAAMPFHPRPVPIDAYCAAILDDVRM
jgi:microcompartment protein CcmK/EutM